MESYYQSLHINKELQLVPLWVLALASSDSCSTAECGLFEMETQIEIERNFANKDLSYLPRSGKIISVIFIACTEREKGKFEA